MDNPHSGFMNVACLPVLNDLPPVSEGGQDV